MRSDLDEALAHLIDAITDAAAEAKAAGDAGVQDELLRCAIAAAKAQGLRERQRQRYAA